MTELGVGYLSIVATTNGMQRDITSAMTGAANRADKIGESAGSKLATGLTRTLKIGVAAGAAAAGGVLAASITKGLSRLTAIDNAQGKLTALGNSTASTAQIMDSALAAVKGTSYGLGDAATIAASAVAAGVKPGQDLTRYLGLTADAAAIAGVNLSEMGQIINKVQTSGTAYTMEITQLADRGLPIWQWLSKEMGVAQSEMKDLVAEGKVDSATYLAAIENNIGGAATAATTASSAWANLGAAQGRFGATLAGPIFRQAIPAFSALTKSVDELDAKAKPVMANFEQDLTGKYIPALLEFGGSVKAGFDEFRNSDLVVSSVGRIGRVIDTLAEAGEAVGPSLKTIGTSLMTASAATGVSTWSVFLSILESVGPILNATVVPALQLVSGLMESNQGAVTALMLGFLAFRTLPNLIGRLHPPMDKLRETTAATATGTANAARGLTTYQNAYLRTGDAISNTRTGLRNFGTEVRATRDFAAAAGRPVGRLSATVLTLGDRAVYSGGALRSLKSGISSAVGALGGPVGVGITAALIAVPQLISAAKNWDKQAEISAAASDSVAESQREMATSFALSRGAIDDSVMSAITDQAKTLTTTLQETADATPGFWEKELVGFKNVWSRINGGDGDVATKDIERFTEAGTAARATLDELKKLEIGSTEIAAALGGGDADWAAFISRIDGAGEISQEAKDQLRGMRGEILKTQEQAKQVTPGVYEVAEAFKILGDEASTTSQKSSALKTSLDILAGVAPDLGDAMSDYNRTIRETKKLFEEPWQGPSGDELIDAKTGGINTESESGADLRGQIVDIRSKTEGIAASGGDVNATLASNAAAFREMAEAVGWTKEQLDGVLEAEGYLPDVIVMAARLEGTDQVTQQLGTVLALMENLNPGEPKVIPVDLLGDDAIDDLRALGFEVEKINGGTQVKITANDDDAVGKLNSVLDQALALNELDIEPLIGARTGPLELSVQQSNGLLDALSEEESTPTVDLIRDKLNEGKQISVNELRELSKETAKPEVILAIAQALADAKIVDQELERITNRQRVAKIAVRIASGETDFGSGFSEAFPVPGLAAGGRRLPTSGPGTERTDGFLAVTSAGMPLFRGDAGEWVINSQSSEKYDRELAAMNAGTFPKLPGFEDGGRVGGRSPRELLDFVNGSQSQPLTGARYDWGGVKWGDCSGAMSAVARFAVGLAPFAARFATATMGSALQAMGYLSGLGGINDLNFGWIDDPGGPGGGHTAGTLPGGTNIEMGGGYGGGMVGGNVGAGAAQFDRFAHLPIGAGDGYAPGSRPARSSRSAPEWTEKQQLQLEEAAIAVTRAEEARSKVESEFAEGKKTQADLDMANKKIELAQQKVVDLQTKKDDVASYVADGPAPQAPALSKMFSEGEIERLDAQLAVESANTRRNEVYDNPDSTPLELAKADADLSEANRKLTEAGKDNAAASSSDTPTSWSGLLGEFAKDFVAGQVEDALSVFGLDNELPGALKAGMMLGSALSERDQAAVSDPGGASQDEIMADSPVLYDPAKGPQQWEPVAEESLRRTGDSLASTATVLERIALRSGGDPANLLALTQEEFAGHRDPSLPDSPANALANLVAGLRKHPIRGYHDGGEVLGTPGRDQIPAFLEHKEFVVRSGPAQSGENPGILRAMNSGANLTMGQQEPSVVKQGSTFNIYAADLDDGIRKWKVAEMVAAHSQLGTL